MDLRKYQNTISKKSNLKKNSYLTQNLNFKTNQSNDTFTHEIKTDKMNSFQNMNIRPNKEKILKNKIQINLYSKPLKFTNGNNIKINNIKNSYISKVPNKNKNNELSLINVSNNLYDTIDFGRNAINKISFNIKQAPKLKLKEKTPFKNRINIQENNKNYETNIINKTKNIYKTKTSNNLKKHTNNYFSSLFMRKNNLLKNVSKTKENISNISLRLFKKETISSKNKIKRHILYTPKKKEDLNDKNIYSKLRVKTVQQSAKRLSKYILTSQNSESRFYTNKTLSPENINNVNNKNKKKHGSLYSKVNYALNNIKNLKSLSNTNSNIALLNKIKNTNLKQNKNSYLIKESNENCQNNSEIHNYLYHNINSPLSQEIIISESKGIISTKCPLGHIINYKFSEFYEKFRAIPDNTNKPLITCFMHKSPNKLAIDFFCGKCFNFICNNCIYEHGRKFGHKIISIHNMNIYCSLHNKKFNSFCYDCNKNSCELCHISHEKKNHNYKSFNDILSQFKSEEKSILNIQNEIRNQLKNLNDIIERYNEDLKKTEHSEILKGYFEEYINYFRNILQLKEKFISKYNYNPNNYYNLMNVLNLALPIIYDYNQEKLFKLSRTNEIYDKYLIINDFVNFVNNNSFNIFQSNQNFKKCMSETNSIKMIRTIKPIKALIIKDDNNFDNNNKYPKQILDLEYNGYFLLLKDFDFDIYNKDLILVKSFNISNLFGNSYNEIIIGVKNLENKNMAIFNYKKILIIHFNYDFLSYQIINEFDIKINGICNGFNNFGFDDETFEIQNPLINNILDMNEKEIISFGIKLEEKYIGTIWQKNKRQESQILDINSTKKNSIYNIISVLKYNENRFAILEKNNSFYYNVKIYSYESPYNTDFEPKFNSENKDFEENKVPEIVNQKHENDKSNIEKNDIIYEENKKDKTINGNNYEKDENVLSDDSEEDIDEVLQEIKINAEKREEEYKRIEESQKKLKKENEDIIIIKKKIFNEIFNLEQIKFKKTNDTLSPSLILPLIKINDKIFAFLDNEYIILVDFEKCSVVSKINYSSNNPLIFIDKTPNDNLLFKEKNKIISYHIKRNDLTRIYLPVYEYREKRKTISKWYLISGSEDFIIKAKIINNSFMICLFEFKMEKWNLNQNLN